MPKIEVNEEFFFQLAGQSWSNYEDLEQDLTIAKAELDEWDRIPSDAGERMIKIELNDTNRPDLWTTAGLARQLRIYRTRNIPSYPFFASKGKSIDAAYRVVVEKSVREVRPWIACFVAKGKPISDALLKDMIQTQEKLAWNYGRKRKGVSIGIYRTGLIEWPVRYFGVEPDSVSFVPLQETRSMTLSQILKEHPKGVEYGSILEGKTIHPLLTDSKGSVLSYPPIINSADIGAVQVDDSEVFIEVTGTDYPSVALSASIMACDFYDIGFEIANVRVDYEYDSPFGSSVIFPYYFQNKVTLSLIEANRLLGDSIDLKKAQDALARMGLGAYCSDGLTLHVTPPEYRNDFLHPVDVAEDIMIGLGIENFAPERPSDFTIGRLTPIEVFSRKAKDIMIGLGYQEMIYNYLGSGIDYAEKMQIPVGQLVKIANPMTENYEYVRNSPIPGLLQTESVSAKASYPHRTFEVGKVAIKDPEENYGVVTRQHIGFLISHAQADYNEIASHVATLMYFLGKNYTVRESADPRFVPGRQVEVFLEKESVGVFGEIHPAVLEAFDVMMPCAAAELDLDSLLIG
ncbi:MAG TPA: phenylalanine--tRNA ligase subunit beta [Rectinema sp.]|nr:phenylalanine--tRNA ligase subunit beta [Spirochaetia bacterium]MDI9426872.1 phenylalanine--tRNA ligase subunit beta [Spirochaetota bacterium]NLH88804.1 phenylalanine--tRNA ligase subunit beta [Treponema sp.]OQC74830.1 MAG: Phenylalanine--tRNA ligase beta subunit [Spirochaetes bacterium ADurb.Bin001]HNZ93027.1 phenylalanine--tRNA ligase subunit beta [Rectinema sp.]